MSKTIYSKEYSKIIQKLRKARKEAGLTQVEVAEAFKKPQSFISKVESGQQRIDVVELKKFAKLYKKKVDYFL